MGKAIIDISTELMRDLLFLPDDAAVLYALQSEWPETIRLVIDSPAVLDVQPEHALPHVAPVFRREQSPSTVTMVDWGLEKIVGFA